jgi:CheY-like chemotaxis protein
LLSTFCTSGAILTNAEAAHYLLPGMNGLQLFDHLQSLETFEQVPVIMITATTMNENIQAALRNRSVALITKPLELADLLAYLEHFHKSSYQ